MELNLYISRTPLIWAISAGKDHIVEFLLNLEKIDINVQNILISKY